ncbi:hypothetical protein FF1_047135 [Malus domestica]
MANQGAKKRKEENARHMANLRRLIMACNVIYVLMYNSAAPPSSLCCRRPSSALHPPSVLPPATRSGRIELPDWTDIVKTASFKELAAYEPASYYITSASMARKIYLRGGLGVGAFRRIYGGSKRN